MRDASSQNMNHNDTSFGKSFAPKQHSMFWTQKGSMSLWIANNGSGMHCYDSATTALSIEFQSSHMIHCEFSHDVFVFTCTTWTLYKTQSRVAIKPEQSQPMALEFILVSYLFCSCCKTCTSERWSHKTTLVIPCCCIDRWIIQQTCYLHFYLRFGTWLTD